MGLGLRLAGFATCGTGKGKSHSQPRTGRRNHHRKHQGRHPRLLERPQTEGRRRSDSVQPVERWDGIHHTRFGTGAESVFPNN